MKRLLLAALLLAAPAALAQTAVPCNPYYQNCSPSTGGSLTVPNSPYIGGNGTALIAAATPATSGAITSAVSAALPSITTSQVYGGTGGAGVAQALSFGSMFGIASNTLSVVTGTASVPGILQLGTGSGNALAGTAIPSVATTAYLCGTGAAGAVAACGVTPLLPSNNLSDVGNANNALANLSKVQRITSGSSATVTAGDNVVVLTSGVTSPFALTFQATPTAGQHLYLLCDSSITISEAVNSTPAGQVLVGSLTSCSSTVGHEWLYIGADTSWRALH